MTPRPQLRTATAQDDASLRALMRDTPLSGPVGLTLEREPSWSAGVLGAERDWTLVGERNGELMGCGSRLLRRTWWNGEPALTAYLGDLRVHPVWQRQSGWLLREGYRRLEEETASHPGVVTWSAIFESNGPAIRTLVGRRGRLPEYVDRGRLLCPALWVRKGAAWPRAAGVTLERGMPAHWGEIAAFLTSEQRTRPLAPVHRAEDFHQGGKWPGLRATDFILLRRGGDLQGLAAVWDLRAVRQVRVQAIRGALRLARLPLWLWHRVSGWPTLPRVGEVLAAGSVSFFAVRDGDVSLATMLLRAARALAAERRLGWLFVCLHELDPLAPVLRGFPGIAAHGRMWEVRVSGCAVEWPAGVPVIEPALL